MRSPTRYSYSQYSAIRDFAYEKRTRFGFAISVVTKISTDDANFSLLSN